MPINQPNLATERVRTDAADQVHVALQRRGIRIAEITNAAKRRADVTGWRAPADLAGVEHYDHGVTLVHAAVYNALAIGVDPTRDPDVLRVLAGRQITGRAILSRVRVLADNAYAEAVADNADKITAKLKPGFDADVTMLRRAAEVLGRDVDLADAEAILRNDARDVALPARDAADSIQNVVTLMHAIDRLTLGTTVAAIHHVADIDADDTDAIELHSIGDQLPDPYSLVQHRLTMSLAGPEAARLRAVRLDGELQQRAADEHTTDAS